MTTIAWDGRVLAADSQSTSGDVICSMNEEKIYQPESGIKWLVNGEVICALGCAGDCGAEEAIKDSMRDGLNYKTEFPEVMSFAAIALTETGKAFLLFKGTDKKSISIAPHYGEYAVGSGHLIARTAMQLGLSAAEAVSHAIKMDVFSGGEVKTFSIGALHHA